MMVDTSANMNKTNYYLSLTLNDLAFQSFDLSVPHEGCSRNAPCALYLISTFLLRYVLNKSNLVDVYDNFHEELLQSLTFLSKIIYKQKFRFNIINHMLKQIISLHFSTKA